MIQQEVDQIAKIYDDAIRAAKAIGGSVVTNKSVKDLEQAKEKFITDANQLLYNTKQQNSSLNEV